MEVTFNVNELEGMKRGELQKLCKSVGIKANSKNSQLIDALREYASRFSEKTASSPVSQQKQPQKTLSEEVHFNEDVKEPEVTDKKKHDGDSYKKQLMDQLDKKVEEKRDDNFGRKSWTGRNFSCLVENTPTKTFGESAN